MVGVEVGSGFRAARHGRDGTTLALREREVLTGAVGGVVGSVTVIGLGEANGVSGRSWEVKAVADLQSTCARKSAIVQQGYPIRQYRLHARLGACGMVNSPRHHGG